MAERGFKIILRFANDVPSMDTCTKCHYKFVTRPSSSVTPQARSCIYERSLSCISVRMSRCTHTENRNANVSPAASRRFIYNSLLSPR